MFDSAWNWMEEHFDFRAEYEISMGAQLAAGIKKAGYAEINAHSYVMQNITYSSKNGIEDPIYQKYLDTDQPQVTTQSLGVAYYVGAEFSTRKDTNGNTMYTFSVGAFCVGGEVSWDKSGIQDWYCGIDLTAKLVVFVGFMFNLKLGFSK